MKYVKYIIIINEINIKIKYKKFNMQNVYKIK